MKLILTYLAALFVACAAAIHVAIENHRWNKHHAAEVQALELGAER